MRSRSLGFLSFAHHEGDLGFAICLGPSANRHEGSGTHRPLLVYRFSVASLHNCMPDSFSLDTYHLEHICEDTQSRIFELCSSRGGLRFCGLTGFAMPIGNFGSSVQMQPLTTEQMSLMRPRFIEYEKEGRHAVGCCRTLSDTVGHCRIVGMLSGTVGLSDCGRWHY